MQSPWLKKKKTQDRLETAHLNCINKGLHTVGIHVRLFHSLCLIHVCTDDAVGAFYYMFGNIRPQLRSKLSVIQLLLLAKYENVKEFGIDQMLESIVKDIKTLESVSYA